MLTVVNITGMSKRVNSATIGAIVRQPGAAAGLSQTEPGRALKAKLIP